MRTNALRDLLAKLETHVEPKGPIARPSTTSIARAMQRLMALDNSPRTLSAGSRA